MKKYLVGGAVRNLLLNIPIRDMDFLVVGSSPEELINLGFKQVAKSFPVFLDPIKNEEYALARSEKKTGYGYMGFSCCYDKSITLEEDLYRRDITINAIALDQNGHFHDPYRGLHDMKQSIIRHVSEAFGDDPLRVLRVVRFYAGLHDKGFTIHDSTTDILKNTIQSGELELLSGERLLLEIKKAMATKRPDLFFSVLSHLGVFERILIPMNQLREEDYHNLLLVSQHTSALEVLLFTILMRLESESIMAILEEIKAPKIMKKFILELKSCFHFIGTWYNYPVQDIVIFIQRTARIKGSAGQELFLEYLHIIFSSLNYNLSSLKTLKQLIEEINTEKFKPFVSLEDTCYRTEVIIRRHIKEINS